MKNQQDNKYKPNRQQQEVIETIDGPLLVIAGPGSGKTATLVNRVIHLIELGVEPEHIMVATFTEKAAKELVTRISNKLITNHFDVNLNEMYIGTLHSIFLRILEEHHEYVRLKKNYRLLEPFEQSFLVYRNLKVFREIEGLDAMVGNVYNSWMLANAIVKKVNLVSEEVLDIDTLITSEEAGVSALGEAYDIYQGLLQNENALDFSSIQIEMLHLLEKNPEVLISVQNQLQYIMVDEYQDTNTVQERILLLLAREHHNLCVVGDDDQGLYRFRGATIRNILEFDNNFEEGECKKVVMSTNYRSHPGIIKFYNDWMNEWSWDYDQKRFRYDKEIIPDDREFPDTASVLKLSVSEDVDAYEEEVYNFIKELKDRGVLTDYNQIAFLYRSVKSDKAVELAKYLEGKGIRVFSPRSDLFFDREEVKLMLGALIMIFPQVEDDKVVYKKSHMYGIYMDWAKFLMAEIASDTEKNKTFLKWILKKRAIHGDLSKNTDYGLVALIYQMLEFPLFRRYLDIDLTANKNDLRPAYNIGILTNILSKFSDLYNISIFTSNNIEGIVHNLFNYYLKFIYDGGIDEYEDFDENIPSGCISFMTIHQSKGLEFPITVVGSMNTTPRQSYDKLDEILQNQYYSKPLFEPLEEIKNYDFARLFYTAFSRAQNLLVLTGCEICGRGRTPSKYFEDCWNKIPSWRDSRYFDMTKLQLAEVHPVNIKHEYSFTSHILLYEACPLQYKFYKELQFVEERVGSTIGGSLLHETIEDIHKAVLRNEIDTLTDTNIEGWFNENYRSLVKQTHSYLHKAQQASILKQVLRYRDRNEDHWENIKQAEVDVSLVKDSYILNGKIDLVKGDNNTVELVDFKSGDKPDVNTSDPYKRKQLQQYRRQLEVYAHLVEEREGVKVSKMHLYYPKEEDGNPKITFNYQQQNVENTIQSFEEIVKKIERHDFSMAGVHCSEKQCAECDMRFYCKHK